RRAGLERKRDRDVDLDGREPRDRGVGGGVPRRLHQAVDGNLRARDVARELRGEPELPRDDRIERAERRDGRASPRQPRDEGASSAGAASHIGEPKAARAKRSSTTPFARRSGSASKRRSLAAGMAQTNAHRWTSEGSAPVVVATDVAAVVAGA